MITDAGHHANVEHLVYLARSRCDEGESPAQRRHRTPRRAEHRPRRRARASATTARRSSSTPTQAPTAFYHDCDRRRRPTRSSRRLRPMQHRSASPHRSGTPAWKTKPVDVRRVHRRSSGASRVATDHGERAAPNRSSGRRRTHRSSTDPSSSPTCSRDLAAHEGPHRLRARHAFADERRRAVHRVRRRARRPRLRLAVAVRAHHRRLPRSAHRPRGRGRTHEEVEARHERAGAPRPQPGARRQGVGQPRPPLRRSDPARVRPRRRRPARAAGVRRRARASERSGSTRPCR